LLDSKYQTHEFGVQNMEAAYGKRLSKNILVPNEV
jgi:hypothetical protein